AQDVEQRREQVAPAEAEPEAQSPETLKQDASEEAQASNSPWLQAQDDSEESELQASQAAGGDAPAQDAEQRREQEQDAPTHAEPEAQAPETLKQDASEEAQAPDSPWPQTRDESEESEPQAPQAAGGDAPAQDAEQRREQEQDVPPQAEPEAQSPETLKQDASEEAQAPDSPWLQAQDESEDSELQAPQAAGGDAPAQDAEQRREQNAPAQAESEAQAPEIPEQDTSEEAQDPEPAQPKRGRGRPKRQMPSDLEIRQALATAFGEVDLECPDDFGPGMADGKWHRCRCDGQDCSNIYDGNGEYLLEWNGWQSSILAYNFAGHKWVYRRFGSGQGRMTRAERREQERTIQKRMAERLRQDKAEADEAASRAQAEWERVPELDKVCGYLEAKGLADVYGLRGTAGQILVPLRNEGGELRALQTITRKDGGFEKRFTKGCKMSGLFFEFPEDDSDGPVCIGEGLATVATVVDAMQWHGLAAMDCGNLDAVVGIARRRWPERQIIVLADNDAIWNADAGGARPHRKGDRRPEEENSGIVKARAAAQKYGVKLAVPPVVDGKCTDFNDVYVRKGGGAAGAEAVQAAVEAAQYVPGCPTPAGFELRLEAGPAGEPGLYALKDGKAGPETVLVGPPLLVEGHVRNSRGGGWGLLVSWRDPDGRDKRISLTRASMASRDRPWLQELVDAGFLANSAQAPDLLKYLESSRPARRFLSPAKTGWLDDGISSFVLPDRVIGAPDGVDPADIVYSGPVTAMYRRAGTLEEWKRHAAILAAGNAKMT
ncbi:MAG: DUF927 domain-containing protein, partial [Desulfovibrio sp.]|nr:DUF927 domain-containing protein [Desulfovibrio sp.]